MKSAEVQQKVKDAYSAFTTDRGRNPSISELIEATNLSYFQIWTAAKSLNITLTSAAQAKHEKEASRQKSEQELKQANELEEVLPNLRLFLTDDPSRQHYYPVLVKDSSLDYSIARFENFKISLSKRYDHIEEMMPEVVDKVKAIVEDYDSKHSTAPA